MFTELPSGVKKAEIPDVDVNQTHVASSTTTVLWRTVQKTFQQVGAISMRKKQERLVLNETGFSTTIPQDLHDLRAEHVQDHHQVLLLESKEF